MYLAPVFHLNKTFFNQTKNSVKQTAVKLDKSSKQKIQLKKLQRKHEL